MLPVFLPEYGQAVSWAMCRNPACVNFGLPYGGPALSNQRVVSDQRYRIVARGGRIECKDCRQSFTLKSNQAIRPLARYCLQLSLPFADCPNSSCSNHGINVFENYVTKGDAAAKRLAWPYRRLDEHRVGCRSCGARFRLGEPLHLARNRAMRLTVRQLIQGVQAKRSISDTIDQTRMSTSSYYSRLKRASARLRDWHAWRNAKLLHERFRRWEGPLRAYTDVIEVSLQRSAKASRHTLLSIVVTVVDLEGTYFILAAHPCFLPKEHCPDLHTLFTEPAKPGFLAEWDCIQHGFGSRVSDSPEKMMRSLPSTGRQGYFTTSHYTELAHFLVVKKMLSRFPKVYHYMDGAVDLYSAALTAFAGDIRSGRAEIVLFQHDKSYRGARPKARVESAGAERTDRKEALLQAEWDRVQAGPEQRARQDSIKLSEAVTDRRHIARIYKSSFKGAYSKVGKWAWLRFPPDTQQFRKSRSLWLTWNPDKAFQDQGRELLLGATLRPVDSAFNLLRYRAKSVRRGSFRAAQGRSYQEAYVRPHVVLAELWIALLWRNYGVRVKTRNKVPPARPMKLTRPKESLPNLPRLVFDFRLGVKEAKRITRWVTR